MSEVYYSSIFSELTKQVQARIDAASELRKRLFDQNVYERFLEWDTPTVGFNFEEIIGSYNLGVAAATLDSKGKESIMGTEGLATIAKKVLIHQMTLPMPIEDYRKVLQLLDSRMISDQAKKQQLVNLMWGGVERVVESVQAKIDIIFLGALSNKGVFSFTQENNPEGGVRGNIDYGMPQENIATADTQWTEGNIDTVDVFEDIQGIVDAAQEKVTFDPHPSGSKAAFVHPAQQEDEAGHLRHGQIIVTTSAGQPKRVHAVERIARIRGDPTDDAHSGQWQDPRIQTVE